jgi:hypothetical protein
MGENSFYKNLTIFDNKGITKNQRKDWLTERNVNDETEHRVKSYICLAAFV